VYGETISKTWQWLKTIDGDGAQVNMGIEAAYGQPPTVAELLSSLDSKDMRLYGEDAPILLPAHVDALAQTSPVPTPEPLVELFLHGPSKGVPDVQVVWRADLDEKRPEAWEEIVGLCPPSSPETMPVPINGFRKWFASETEGDDAGSDLPIGVEEYEPKQRRLIRALVWRGDESAVIERARDVKPGQTVILPVSAGGWNEVGHIPDNAMKDLGDRAAFDIRRSVSLRLHSEVMKEWPQAPALKGVLEYASQEGAEPDEMRDRLMTYLAELDADSKPWPYAFLIRWDELRPKLIAYPDREPGYVLEGRRATQPAEGTGRVLLDTHLRHVEAAVEEMASELDPRLKEALMAAAKFHDYGKVDVRYQAWLFGGDLMAPLYAPKPVAKSGIDRLHKQEAVGLPKGFRHELLSLLFAERSEGLEAQARDLALHLVASHHGRCRPFAPVTLDENANCVSYGGISICKRERMESAPWRLDSEVADRFWMLTRRYGWWGLAHMEALLRLADWRASEKENAEVAE
jgi:CRISPR-associated endonuclease/helicase Cas3